MPISPDRMARYPGGSIRSAEWLAIRERILERAGDRCEQCYAPNNKLIYRVGDLYMLEDGSLHGAIDGAFAGVGRVTDMPKGRYVQVVLTIAHLDQDETNNADDNLRALCQRCHNRHDHAHRQANAAKTRRKRRAERDLFE